MFKTYINISGLYTRNLINIEKIIFYFILYSKGNNQGQYNYVPYKIKKVEVETPNEVKYLNNGLMFTS